MATKNPLLSVIVPTLNEEKYLEHTLKSIKNQDYRGKYEIIVVDSNSKDKTVKIARKYADKVLISSKRNSSSQRNLGAKKAKGNILAFLDADTIVDKHWVKSIFQIMSKEDIVGVTGSFYPLENIKGKYLYSLANNFQRILIKLKYPLFNGASCAFKKDVFLKIGGFDENLKMSEDHDISLRMVKYGKMVFNSEMIAFTSARRFLKDRNGALFFYINDILDYFVLRKFKRYKIL